MSRRPFLNAFLVSLISMGCGLEPGCADTISAALARAYVSNPDLNQQRAGSRSTDELVARAKAAYRPQVSGNASLGYQYTNVSGPNLGVVNGPSVLASGGLVASETLFDGNRTANGVRQAESQVFQSREQIRNTEQTTLVNGATAYMNVLRDTAILELNRNNITVLEEQLRQTRNRYRFGDVTHTDVAQAESSLALGRSTFFTAQANLQTSIANFRQVIGTAPGRLEAARPITPLLPPTLAEAVAVALGEHPTVQAALHNVDVASAQVQINEGQLYPTLAAVGTVQQSSQYAENIPGIKIFSASAVGQVTVPIYSGGDVYASVRQAKELVAQARLQAEVQRDQVRATVVSTYGQVSAAKAVIRSSMAAVKASEIALSGVRDEAKVGQRTTFDILTAQQTLLSNRVNLVSAQRDLIVASYTALAAVGRLSAATLGLAVVNYDPTVHFGQVKDKWIGLRTPDGR